MDKNGDACKTRVSERRGRSLVVGGLLCLCVESGAAATISLLATRVLVGSQGEKFCRSLTASSLSCFSHLLVAETRGRRCSRREDVSASVCLTPLSHAAQLGIQRRRLGLIG